MSIHKNTIYRRKSSLTPKNTTSFRYRARTYFYNPFLITLLLIALPYSGTSAQQYDDWLVSKRSDPGLKSYSATSKSPSKLSEFSVGHSVAKGLWLAVSFTRSDAEFMRDSDVEVHIGSEQFVLAPSLHWAILKSDREAYRLVQAMKRGQTMKVFYALKGGKFQSATFSLIGFTAAMRKVNSLSGFDEIAYANAGYSDDAYNRRRGLGNADPTPDRPPRTTQTARKGHVILCNIENRATGTDDYTIALGSSRAEVRAHLDSLTPFCSDVLQCEGGWYAVVLGGGVKGFACGFDSREGAYEAARTECIKRGGSTCGQYCVTGNTDGYSKPPQSGTHWMGNKHTERVCPSS